MTNSTNERGKGAGATSTARNADGGTPVPPSSAHPGPGKLGSAGGGELRAHARVTSRDVAARAGVSQSAVSLVLSGNPNARIADATRQRVIDAAQELEYRPNLLARGLVQRRSFALGVIVPDLGNPFFTEMVSGAERVGAEAGYGMLLADAREISAAEHLHRLAERQVDGVILGGAIAATVPPELLAGKNVVVVDEPSGRCPGVVSDAHGAGRMAAAHLLALGHRELAFLGPASPSHAFRMRERGFVHGLREAGIELTSPWLCRVPPTVPGGERGMRAILESGSRPTAVFCVNDLSALGALKACAAAGVSVPSQMSIVGCDDIEMARYVTPELTTVRVPARGLGARAARLLLLELDDRDTSALTGKHLAVQLIVRGTTAPPPGAPAPMEPSVAQRWPG